MLSCIQIVLLYLQADDIVKCVKQTCAPENESDGDNKQRDDVKTGPGRAEAFKASQP